MRTVLDGSYCFAPAAIVICCCCCYCFHFASFGGLREEISNVRAPVCVCACVCMSLIKMVEAAVTTTTVVIAARKWPNSM